MYATLDIQIFDLFGGNMEFIKNGALKMARLTSQWLLAVALAEHFKTVVGTHIIYQHNIDHFIIIVRFMDRPDTVIQRRRRIIHRYDQRDLREIDEFLFLSLHDLPLE